jgi:hypothetical protein
MTDQPINPGVTQPGPTSPPTQAQQPPPGDPQTPVNEGQPSTDQTALDNTAALQQLRQQTEDQARIIAAMQAHLEQVTTQLASAQAAQAASAPAAPVNIESGEYEPNDRVTVVAWPKDGTPPDGYQVVTTSGNVRLAVKQTATGEVERDADGNANAVAEGTAVVIHGDGRYQHIDNADDAAWFTRRYAKAGA